MGLLSSSTAPTHSAEHAAATCSPKQHPGGGREDGEMFELQAEAGQRQDLGSEREALGT